MYYTRADAYTHIRSYMLHWCQSTGCLLFTPSSLLFSCSLGTRRWKTWRPHTPHGPTFQCWAAPHSWSLWLRINWSLAPRLDSRLQTPAGGWSLRTHNCSFHSDGKKVRGASLIRAWNLIYLRWWQQQQQQNHPSFINYSEKLQTAEALDSHCLIFPWGFLSGVQCMTVSSVCVCVWVCVLGIPYCVLALSLHTNVNSRQSCAADVVRHESVGVGGFGHGQRASSELAVHRRLSEPLGLLHQQVVPLLCLLQPQDDCTGKEFQVIWRFLNVSHHNCFFT